MGIAKVMTQALPVADVASRKTSSRCKGFSGICVSSICVGDGGHLNIAGPS